MTSPGPPAFLIVLSLKIGKTLVATVWGTDDPLGVQTGLTYIFGLWLSRGGFWKHAWQVFL